MVAYAKVIFIISYSLFHSRQHVGTISTSMACITFLIALRQVAPSVLLLHLKRFQFGGRGGGGGRGAKISTHVSFPFNLDISHLLSAPSSQGSTCAARSSGSAYQLVGLIEHQGASLRSGHYVAYVKRRLQLGAAGGGAGSVASDNHADQSEQARADSGGGGGTGCSTGMEGGLTAVAAADAEQWYCASDTHVRAVTRQQVAAVQAYVLMYVR